jgi:hypothetical protein
MVRWFPLFLALANVEASLAGCKKKEEEVPPPPPPAAPAPTPAPAPVPIATEEEASAPLAEDVPDVRKIVPHAPPADVAGLRACCTALQQNAASMPPPNNTYALQAAQVCYSLVSALAAGSTTKAGALGSINSLLKGANLPPACK